MTRRDWVAALLVFCAFFGFLWMTHAGRLLLGTNDEGIILDAGQRMVEGRKPYVDFWSYMTPGSMWTQALAFRIAGVTHRGARLPVIFFFALQCAILFALVARLSSRFTAVVTTLFFFAFQSARSTLLTSQHRWDSAALACLAVLLVLEGTAGAGAWLLAAGGAAMAYATVSTPSLAIPAAFTLIWLAARREQRRFALWFAAGALFAGVASLLATWHGGYLGGLIDQIHWLSRKYSSVNTMPYGSIIGGYSAHFEGAAAGQHLVNAVVLLYLTLPASLPPFAAAGWGLALLRGKPCPISRPDMLFLLLSLPCLIATTFPRADVDHLVYIALPAFALSAALVFHFFPSSLRTATVLFFGFGAALFLWNSMLPAFSEPVVSTPIGRLRSTADEAPGVVRLLSTVQRGDSLYVHPYRPMFYFLTQGRNPTRYSYLAPGMMDAEDERIVLADLERQPPQWVLFLELPLEVFRRVFPAGNPARLRFGNIEEWIHRNYKRTDVVIGGYGLWRRN